MFTILILIAAVGVATAIARIIGDNKRRHGKNPHDSPMRNNRLKNRTNRN